MIDDRPLRNEKIYVRATKATKIYQDRSVLQLKRKNELKFSHLWSRAG